MRRSVFRPTWLLLVIVLLVAACEGASSVSAPTNTTPSATLPAGASVPYLHLPPGFRATVFASGLSGPRFMAFAPNGMLLVANRGKGEIVALSDPGHTGRATAQSVIASGLNDPTSVVYDQGALYVGEANQVTRLAVDAQLRVTNKQVIVPDVPTDGAHITRTVLVGPDGMLYLSIGSTCNDCVESDSHRAVVMQFQRDGSGGSVYMSGLRNAVGLAINPLNQQIWATDNGRDNLGDNTPPETIYDLQAGANAGWPRCHAGDIIDPDLGHAGDCNGVAQPLVQMQAHSAPLGLAFYTATQFPAQWRGLFVAFHGSWNRTVPTGYKVIFLPLNTQGEISGPPQDFATGWLAGATVHGRPVGLAVGPDGALYVSDDQDGNVYRIVYGG